MPFIGLLTGPIGKYLGILAGALALAAAAAFFLHEHDLRVVAQRVVVEQAAVRRQTAINNAAVVRSLESDLVSARARAVTADRERAAIAAAPITHACANAPAIEAVERAFRAPKVAP